MPKQPQPVSARATRQASTVTLCALLLGAASGLAHADSAEVANKSNNPLSVAPGLNVQDSYVPELYDSNAHTNELTLRGTLPLLPGELIGVPQLLRASVPVHTRSDPSGGYSTGVGDLNLFDIFLLKTEGIRLGVGPQITAPTAAEDELGTGKWQAGFSAIMVDDSTHGVIGGLLQYQRSFAGDSHRADVETATLQPFLHYNLSEGWYLRSSGTWTFDLENHTHYIPLGLGVGKATLVGRNIYNLFIEPQWTVEHKGEGLPQFTLYAGLSIHFGE